MKILLGKLDKNVSQPLPATHLKATQLMSLRGMNLQLNLQLPCITKPETPCIHVGGHERVKVGAEPEFWGISPGGAIKCSSSVSVQASAQPWEDTRYGKVSCTKLCMRQFPEAVPGLHGNSTPNSGYGWKTKQMLYRINSGLCHWCFSMSWSVSVQTFCNCNLMALAKGVQLIQPNSIFILFGSWLMHRGG